VTVSVEIRGGEKFAAVAAKLRSSNKELRPRLYKVISQATSPLKRNIRSSARSMLPSRGGLANLIARSSLTTKKSVAARSAGVRIVGSSKNDIKKIDKGRLRHPTFSHRPWVTQSVPAGYFTKPMTEGAPAVAAKIEAEVDVLSAEIEAAGS
jgi:hypothetical protein